MSWYYYLILFAYAFLAFILIGFVLLRKGEGGGLSGAFGGMGGEPVFGVKAAKQLDKIITYIAIIFLGFAILLNLPRMRGQASSGSSDESEESSN